MPNNRPDMSDQDRKLLWGKAGNRCAICKKLLVNMEDNDERGVIVGIEAHIVAHSTAGARGNNPLPLSERHKYENMILLCSDHARIIDERPDKWTTEKLRRLKKEHEQLMMGLSPTLEHPHPVLRLIQPIGYSGGSRGYFQSLRLKNFDGEAALDLKCWISGFGFYHLLSSQTAGSYLEPGESRDYSFQLDGLRIKNEDVHLLYFNASYSTLDGQKILYKLSLVQRTVPSGALKIIELGEENEYSKLRNNIDADVMIVLDSQGDYEEAEYTVGENKFKIKVSRTLLSMWGMNDGGDIQLCFLEIGRSNLKIMTSLGVYQDKEYYSTSFPKTYATGFDRFVEALKHIESGSY